ncbi:MAG: molecular chaperone DnaJ [Patescibacteria group bacterium]|nr:molecular chaperone DnaJ [Patescibacteria group bacterium]
MSKDYYKILGVEKSASEDEIKKAFRRKAHEHHPDKKNGNEQAFKDVNEAYGILGDKANRAKYDQFGSAAFDPSSAQGFGGQGGFGGFDFNNAGFNVNVEDFGDLGDILGGMFGFGGGRGRQKRGRDLELEVDLEFKEAVFGAQKEVNIYTNNECETCKGTGAEPGSKISQCETCKGAGKVQQQQRTMLGTFNTVVVCPACHGKGEKAEKDCGTCSGSGIQKKERKLSINIPAGMSHGEALKLSGQGDFPGVGGKAGDLYIRVKVKRDPVFVREDHNILSTIKVPFTIMSLGGKVDVETVDGPVVLKIPSGTEAKSTFKLRGKGVPYMSGYGRGDHMVTVMPDVPQKLTREQKKLLEELQREGL